MNTASSGENPWVTHSTAQVYSNPWIDVSHHEVTTPTGTPGIYGVVNFVHRAVGVVPIDESGNTWLVGQYRYACNEYSWEIPAGGGTGLETPVDTARRELREECGLEATSVEHILTARLSNSVTDETAYIHVATGLSPCPTEPDDSELISIRKLPLAEALAMVHDGTINDAITILGLLHVDTSGRHPR